MTTTVRPIDVLLAWMRAARSVFAAIAGVPDYERYLRHVHERHPEATALGRDEFIHDQLSRRYNRPGSRCC